MLYQAYQWQDDLMAPLRGFARSLRASGESAWGLGLPGGGGAWDAPWDPVADFRRQGAAALELLSRFELSHERPAFAIDSVESGGARVAVEEQTVLTLPFARLLRFAKASDPAQPRVLVVAPLSGHFSTLLRGTIRTLLRDHEVFVTDWLNARDVPAEAGRFGIDDYVAYLIRFLEEIGAGAHVLAVCQPCVQTLAAVAVMSEERHEATPLSMTLMAGPIDPRESPTGVNEFAVSKSLAWFESAVIARVPARYRGAGRRVYPGFLQLAAFVAMNLERHRSAHRKLYRHLAAGEEAEAATIKAFYDEYFAVLDMTEEFYLETIDRIFQRAELATGDYSYRGRPVDPGAIRHTALLTVEGGRDDICALGQTAAAHDLCRSLRPHLKRHHLQANVGHYGVFNGKRWEREIYPVVRNLILAVE